MLFTRRMRKASQTSTPIARSTGWRCGVCKKFKPQCDAAAKLLSKQASTLLVAKMDASQNQVHHKDVNIASYPDLVAFARVDKTHAMRQPTSSANALVEWVKKHFRYAHEDNEL
eukprot:SAG31_NODE_836_length_11643_cov_3.389813_5_plen_114_part_00